MALVSAKLASAILAVSLGALAYNPPVDTAGSLTARIHEPALGAYGAGGNLKLTSPDVPIPIEITLTNAGDAEVSGTLRVGVIDGWTVTPAEAVPFRVAPRAQADVNFTVRAVKGSFNAHYPVHAYAEFEQGGRKLTAHPILILETQYPDPPRAYLPLEWKPMKVAPDSAFALEKAMVHRESAVLSSGSRMLAGTRAGEPFEVTEAVQFGGDAIKMLIGPRATSKREVVASAATEFPLALPAGEVRFEARCAGGNALARVMVGVEGRKAEPVAEGPCGGSRIEANLTRFAGNPVTLRLEASSSAGGAVTWMAPTVVAGKPAARATFPPGASAKPVSLGKAGEYEVRLWPGKRGLLDSAIGFVKADRRLLFSGFHVQVFGEALESSRSTTALESVKEEATQGRHRVRHTFSNAAGSFDVVGEVWTGDGALHARWWLENAPAARPWLVARIEEVRAGSWSEDLRRVYLGPGNVIERPEAFHLSFDGHNMATSFAGFDFANGVALTQAADVPPERIDVDPKSRTYSLAVPHAQTVSYFPGATVWDGVKAWRDQNGLKPSAGVPKLAGRFVFDLWEWYDGYGKSAAALRKAFQYGLTDSVVVWHNWQRWAYDYRLPDVYPPNPQGGTVEEFRDLVSACREAGVLFAPHDNYIDFYPDATGFSYEDVVFRGDGSPYRAWFRAEFNAQSFRFRPDRVHPFVERNLKLIKESFAPTAYFIDVWSSMGPYDFWTSGGEFHERQKTRKAWGETFAWIRDFLGGAPQISEAGHDQLIGWLDGAQAQVLRVDPSQPSFTWKINAADSERAPWFDAAHHDRIVLHGAGYPDRYAGGLPAKEHGIYSDDYISTEVLTGHPAMVADAFSTDVVRKYWLLHDAMRAVAGSRIANVEYDGGSIHRAHVSWENGVDVYVNRGAGDWTTAGHTLPQYGFYLKSRSGDVEAAIERLEGGTVEWAKSPAAVYVNGRGRKLSIQGVEAEKGVRVVREGGAERRIELP